MVALEEVLRCIKPAIADHLNVAESRVTIDATLANLGIIPLDIDLLARVIEEDMEFIFGKKIKITDEAKGEITTVGDLCNLVAELLG